MAGSKSKKKVSKTKQAEEINNNNTINMTEGSTKEVTQTDKEDERLEDVQQIEIDNNGGGEETKTNEEENAPEEQWDIVEVKRGYHNVVCRMEGCNDKAVAVWKSNLDVDHKDLWPLCEPCQKTEFGDDDPKDEVANMDGKSNNDNKKDPISQTIKADATKEPSPPEPVSSTIEQAYPAPDVEDEDDGDWDMKKVYSIKDLNDLCPIKCSHDHCTLQAAVLYVSTETSKKWHSCLDCQINDYDGWPELDEIPISYMTPEHKQLMLAKCTRFGKSTKMPNFPNMSTPMKTTTLGNTVTPLPNSNLNSQKQKGDGAVITPMEASNKKHKKKEKNAHMAIHAKWREAAIAAGGPNAQIVIKHSEAKKIIFDYLYDSFSPQNITQIYKGLKAVVPSPVLKACLDSMALDDETEPFLDSDDEDSGKKKKAKPEPTEPTEEFKMSLCFKSGRGKDAGLYYVDYNKAKNGNGLEGDEKNELLSDVAKSESKADALTHSLKTMTATTTKLLSEPLNDEATILLKKGEDELDDLNQQLDAARKLAVNEKHKQNLKGRVGNMANIWRKRKRLCMEFLIQMEENSDGAVTAKKCFKGDGPKGLEVESDEAVSSAALEYHKNKKSKTLGGKNRLLAKSASHPKKEGIVPTESFVAVHLSAQGRVERIYADEEAK